MQSDVCYSVTSPMTLGRPTGQHNSAEREPDRAGPGPRGLTWPTWEPHAAAAWGSHRKHRSGALLIPQQTVRPASRGPGYLSPRSRRMNGSLWFLPSQRMLQASAFSSLQNAPSSTSELPRKQARCAPNGNEATSVRNEASRPTLRA